MVLYKSNKYFNKLYSDSELTINETICTLESVINNHHNTLKEKQQYIITSPSNEVSLKFWNALLSNGEANSRIKVEWSAAMAPDIREWGNY